MKIFLLMSFFIMVGCATTHPVQQLVEPKPLTEISVGPKLFTTDAGEITAIGPTMWATRGEGLRLAGAVHHLLSVLGIANEASCRFVRDGAQAQLTAERLHLEIIFPKGLTDTQRQGVLDILTGLQTTPGTCKIDAQMRVLQEWANRVEQEQPAPLPPIKTDSNSDTYLGALDASR